MFRLIADQQRRSNQRKLGLLLGDCIQVGTESLIKRYTRSSFSPSSSPSSSPPPTIHITIIIIPTMPIIINIIPTILIITTTTIISAMTRFLVCWARSQLLEESTSSRACEAASRRLETPGSLRWRLFSTFVTKAMIMMTTMIIEVGIVFNFCHQGDNNDNDHDHGAAAEDDDND